MTTLALVLLAPVALGFVLRVLAQALRTIHQTARAFEAHVRVVDGDTLAVGAQRIRILGCDAPEMNTEAGRCAKTRMAQLVAGAPVRFVPQGQDVYGRLLARAYDAYGVDLARRMVAEGHARATH